VLRADDACFEPDVAVCIFESCAVQQRRPPLAYAESRCPRVQGLGRRSLHQYVGAMTPDDPIVTSRLRLVSLSPTALEMLLDDNIYGASEEQGFEFTNEFLATVNQAFLTIQRMSMRNGHLTPGWFVRGILRKDDDVLIGHCGFHGTPSDIGRAEIGYTIFLPYRRRGYASEAAQGLEQWARSQGSPVVFATVSSTNVASLALVTKLGFQRTGPQHADGDGEDIVFEVGP